MKGAVKPIFQPAEEIMQGAEEMIKDNVLKIPVSTLSLVCQPEIQGGCVGVKEARYLPRMTLEIKVRVSGSCRCSSESK